MPGPDDAAGRLVWSSEHGKMCPRCGKAEKECVCGRRGEPPPQDGVVRVGRETKGRKGKGVTTVAGIPLDAAGIEALARELKARCGAGGTVVRGVIEIQGEHRDAI
ncbi:MAG: stress response translation initiation inhibitor YciH, partial [Planctomycetes bacterium]|nr:stress response translation initiation inhibitor YciH [Planctomycetota bacterium]